MQYPSIDTVAIGRFDGLHLGHQALIDQLGDHGMLVVIDTHGGDLTPADILVRYTDTPYYCFDFESIRHLSPAEFVALLQDIFPALSRIVVGDDFKFGHGRSGDSSTLRELFCAETIIIPELTLDSEPIRSSRIRHYIRLGDICRAHALLGRPYRIFARALSHDTLCVAPFLLPERGEYEVNILLDPKPSPTSLRVLTAETAMILGYGLTPNTEYEIVFTGMIL